MEFEKVLEEELNIIDFSCPLNRPETKEYKWKDSYEPENRTWVC
jgi:hypothetical protein